MLDGLPNGVNELHLSGRLGLADLGGNPLPANDPSGDYVIRFTVNGPPRGIDNNPQTWSTQPSNDQAHPQAMGVLFPDELQNDLVVTRDFGAGQFSNLSPIASSADYYQFQVLQSRMYTFSLSDADLPNSISLTLITPDGQTFSPLAGTSPHVLNITLDPNVTYTLRVGEWAPGQATVTVYHLHMDLSGSAGPAPVDRRCRPGPADSPGHDHAVHLIRLVTAGDRGGAARRRQRRRDGRHPGTGQPSAQCRQYPHRRVGRLGLGAGWRCPRDRRGRPAHRLGTRVRLEPRPTAGRRRATCWS